MASAGFIDDREPCQCNARLKAICEFMGKYGGRGLSSAQYDKLLDKYCEKRGISPYFPIYCRCLGPIPGAYRSSSSETVTKDCEKSQAKEPQNSSSSQVVSSDSCVSNESLVASAESEPSGNPSH